MNDSARWVIQMWVTYILKFKKISTLQLMIAQKQ